MMASLAHGLLRLTLSSLIIATLHVPVYGRNKLYSIQVGAYKDPEYALRQVHSLRQPGYDAFYRKREPGEANGLYRVYVGRYGSRQEAANVAQRLKGLGLISNYYVRPLIREDTGVPVGLGGTRRTPEVPEASEGRGSEAVREMERPRHPRGATLRREAPRTELRDIRAVYDERGEETLYFQLNAYRWPQLHLALESNNPRVEIIFEGTEVSARIPSTIPLSGRLLRTVAIQSADREGPLRVALDLKAHLKYELTQAFYRPENIYAFRILEAQRTPGAFEKGKSHWAETTRPDALEWQKVPFSEWDPKAHQGLISGVGLYRGEEPEKGAETAVKSDEGLIASMLESWRVAWQGKRLREYMAFYHPDFEAEGRDLTAWKVHKGRLNRRYDRISVQLSGLKIKLDGKRALAYFRQAYRADSYRDVGYKRLILQKAQGSWKIIGEEWFPKKPVDWPT